jgi:hypothetical protein
VPLDAARLPQVVGETADLMVSVECAENSQDAEGNTCIWSKTETNSGLQVWSVGEPNLNLWMLVFGDSLGCRSASMKCIQS